MKWLVMHGDCRYCIVVARTPLDAVKTMDPRARERAAREVEDRPLHFRSWAVSIGKTTARRFEESAPWERGRVITAATCGEKMHLFL